MTFYRMPGGGEIYCPHCLPEGEAYVAAALAPAQFPGTWHMLCCVACGTSAGEVIPGTAEPALAVAAGDVVVAALPTHGEEIETGDLIARDLVTLDESSVDETP